jgi:Mg2+-importing ATPase
MVRETDLNPLQRVDDHPSGKDAPASGQLLDKARADTATVLQQLASQSSGLTAAVAESRLKQYGFNEVAREKHHSALIRLLSNVRNPLVILLTALGVVSFLTGDQRATVVIFVMVLLGVVLRFVQEMRADHAAEQLKAMVSNTATVVRDGQESELSLKMLVPGDLVRLAAGDMVPADVRVLSAKDLFGHCEGIVGHHPAGEQPADPRAGGAGRPPSVWQHHQVHQDGRQLQLR